MVKFKLWRHLSYPSLCFVSPSFPLQKNIIKLVDSTIYSFIWKGKDKIKRLALIKTADWECLTFRQWLIRNVLCVLGNILKIMLALGTKFSIFVKDYGSKFLLHCNFSVADLPSCLPNFYREYFEVWCNLSKKPIFVPWTSLKSTIME